VDAEEVVAGAQGDEVLVPERRLEQQPDPDGYPRAKDLRRTRLRLVAGVERLTERDAGDGARPLGPDDDLALGEPGEKPDLLVGEAAVPGRAERGRLPDPLLEPGALLDGADREPEPLLAVVLEGSDAAVFHRPLRRTMYAQ
jgi:hypothetical protein